MTLYLDLDGVFFDFDKAAGRLLKTTNIYKYEFVWGSDKFWDVLNSDPEFFAKLELLPDAMWLWNKVKHLRPPFLTAIPRENGERVDEQKRRAVSRHFGDAKVITCETKDKPNFCKPGDILIDDRAVNREAWIAKGGTYIIHTTAARTVGALQALGIID